MPDMVSISSWSTGVGGACPYNSRRQSSPPSPQARHPASQRVLKVYEPMGMDIHLLTCDVEQLTDVVPLMLSLTKTMICDLQLVVLL
jgi:hypothetical protein